MNEPEEQLLTVEDVAKMLHIHPDTVHDCIRRQGLRYAKLGPKTFRFRRAWVLEFLDKKWDREQGRERLKTNTSIFS